MANMAVSLLFSSEGTITTCHVTKRKLQNADSNGDRRIRTAFLSYYTQLLRKSKAIAFSKTKRGSCSHFSSVVLLLLSLYQQPAYLSNMEVSEENKSLTRSYFTSLPTSS